MHEVLARLLSIAHDVQARVLLGFEPQERGILFGLDQLLPLGAPLRPELIGLGQPTRFGQAPGERGFKHAQLLT